MQINAILAYSYHVNQFLFPVLMRGAAYSMTNFVSRPVIGLATFITEYTNNPMLLVAVFSAVNIAATFIIKEPTEEEELPLRANVNRKVSDVSTTYSGREPPFNASIRPEPRTSCSYNEVERIQASLLASNALEPMRKSSPLPTGLWRQSSQRLFGTFFSADQSALDPSATVNANNERGATPAVNTTRTTYKSETYYKM